MKIWILITVLLIFFLFEFMAAFSFNIKIKKIDQKKYTHAALLGAFSTTLFTMLALSAPLIAADTQVWFIFAGAFMMASGNVTALLLLRPFEKWLATKKNDSIVKEAE